MALQLACTALRRGSEAVLARAVVGLPGLVVLPKCGTFRTSTQANARARQLNQRLGLSQSQSRAIVTDAILSAQALVRECDSLMQIAKSLGQRQRQHELACILKELELGVTFCHIACARHDVLKERLIADARNTVSRAMSAVGRFDSSLEGMDQFKAGIDRLQSALDECAPKESFSPSAAASCSE